MYLLGIQKIEQLVKSSPILSAQERAEWLALLDLMDDKQLGELEKILASAPAPKISNDKFQISNSSPKFNPTQAQMPKLSHIVNLPTIRVSDNQNVRESESQKIGTWRSPIVGSETAKPSAPVLSRQAEKKNAGFAAKLRSIFGEKELTAPPPELELPARAQQPAPSAPPQGSGLSAGRQGFPLELPDGKELKSLTLTNIFPAAKKSSVPSQGSGPSVKVPLKPKIAPPPIPHPPIPPKKPKILSMPAPPTVVAPKAAQPRFSDDQKRAVASLAPDVYSSAEAKYTKSGAGFAAGINFPKISEKSRSDDLSTIKEHLLEKTARPAPTAVRGTQALKEAALDNLDALALLDVRTLQNYDIGELLKKIRPLTQSHGYFDVIFKLENSPVFKAYTATGLKLLERQIGFEKLADTGAPGEYLTKVQFEKFTDLLSKIQMG